MPIPGCTRPSSLWSCAHDIYAVLMSLDFAYPLVSALLFFISSFHFPQTQLGLSSALGLAHGCTYPTVLELLVVLLIKTCQSCISLQGKPQPCPLASLHLHVLTADPLLSLLPPLKCCNATGSSLSLRTNKLFLERAGEEMA